jgi:hypothetical protein
MQISYANFLTFFPPCNCQIANIGPASYNYEETVSTLRYASRAKRIQNVARINEDPKDALLRRFQEEIEQLKRALEDVGELTFCFMRHFMTFHFMGSPM